MDKKIDILNQMAVVSDLIEKLPIDSKSSTIIFELSNVEFEKIFDIVQKKYNKRAELPKNTFTISIGRLDIVFNTSNV